MSNVHIESTLAAWMALDGVRGAVDQAGEMSAEEYLAEQARKAAAEAVPNLFTMEMVRAEAMEMTRKQDLTLNNEHVTQSEAWAHLEELAGKPLHNRQLDKEAEDGKLGVFVAYINKPQRKELSNINKAKMSAKNGFSVDSHYAAVSRIEKLFENAVYCGEYPDLKHGEETVHIHRFACPMMIDGEKAVAWLTAKQTMNVEGSERLYNLELVDIEKLAVTLEYLASHRLDTALRPASEDIVAQIEDAFKSYFEEVPDFSTFSANMEIAKEMEEIKAAAVADGTFMKAPNGKDSNLNERQWLQVRTKAFVDWFGDWERTAELTFKGDC